MDIYLDNKVLIREINEERDLELVERLERSCEIGSTKSLSILTDTTGDPLCRIRLYPLRVMLVAELVRDGELVGIVRGCLKCVGTGSGATPVKLGCILGLRVSPKHRRMGIGTRLVKSIEGWAIRNGAEYNFLAAEENNVASTNLFLLKCDYVKLSSLVILIQPIKRSAKMPSRDVAIEKLSVDQATSLYTDRLGGKAFFPVDIDVILKEELSLGTWVSFFKDEEWDGLQYKEQNKISISETPASWAILSIWKTCEAYKFHTRGAEPFNRCFQTTSKSSLGAFPCLRVPLFGNQTCEAFGFLFLYGIYGEGERVGELMKSLWYFACNVGKKIKGCKAIVSEVGTCDPLREHIPWAASISCISDLWCFKRVGGSNMEEDRWCREQSLSHLFVDPRDF